MMVGAPGAAEPLHVMKTFRPPMSTERARSVVVSSSGPPPSDVHAATRTSRSSIVITARSRVMMIGADARPAGRRLLSLCCSCDRRDATALTSYLPRTVHPADDRRDRVGALAYAI